MMKEISQEAKLSTVYTNHCVRATAITLWSQSGLENRQIMAISGHRNESSLRSYNSRPSVDQLRQCSDILSVALNGEDSRLPPRFPLEIQQDFKSNPAALLIFRASISSAACSTAAPFKTFTSRITSKLETESNFLCLETE